jgi:hypothetical protein
LRELIHKFLRERNLYKFLRELATMAEKNRVYITLVTAMDRKARELTENLGKTDSQERIARSKHEKLLSDISELVKLGEDYIATLSEEDERQ